MTKPADYQRRLNGFLDPVHFHGLCILRLSRHSWTALHYKSRGHGYVNSSPYLWFHSPFFSISSTKPLKSWSYALVRSFLSVSEVFYLTLTPHVEPFQSLIYIFYIYIIIYIYINPITKCHNSAIPEKKGEQKHVGLASLSGG